MLTSLQIAQAAKLRPIHALAEEIGLLPDELEPYGHHMGKVRLSVLSRLADRPDGKLVLVTAITPTPLGEGKTTSSIGLVQGLKKIGVRAAVTLRQPSLGPVFGIKGGGAGGGYSQVVPMEPFNLHLTGDAHAVSAAHNLASAFLDNHLHHGNRLGIDPFSIGWPRVVDMNDRTLRHAVIGLGGKEDGTPREAEWIITAASEVMAILALASDFKDLRARLARAQVARRRDKSPVTLEDLKVAGAMTVLLRDAIMPNLLQTLEGVPAFVHAGPFGNIAQGTNSVLADRIALKLADVVCTEAGFGADLGAEKFFNIKCRQSGLRPSGAVVVATLRALKMHGGIGKIVAGKPLDEALLAENVEAVRKGAANLAKHVENVRQHGIPCVVAINSFPTDTPAEVAAVRDVAIASGARDAVVSRHFADGGDGAADLARAVRDMVKDGGASFRFLYRDDASLAEKIETIATKIYGADGIDLGSGVAGRLGELEKGGQGHLPICMAKTHLSLSHDASLKGRPTGFRVPIREVRLSAGAGFITAVAGEMRLMPGLSSKPSGEGIDIDESGQVVGLF
ncbi:MAG: formate--tetrahydrofolate ligase [Deltaproteobacteria bacterium]|nr:formate--tetrahydrofolate ligase [Deltaproteobacteria bacterium]